MTLYRVGVVGPFSGPRASYGNLLKKIIISSKYSDYFEFIFKDDKADPEVSFIVANELVSKKVDGVIGHFNSSSASIASIVYKKAKIPLILPASTVTELTKHKHVYRLCPTNLQQSKIILNAFKKFNYTDCYIWTDKSEYAESIFKYINHLNIKQLNLSTKVKNKTLIIFLGSHYKIADIFNKLNYNGYITAICCDDCSIDHFYQITKDIKTIIKYVICPKPNFKECIFSSIQLLYEILSKNIKDFKPVINNRENEKAKFKLLRI